MEERVITKLGKLGDRLLARLVPKVEASAGALACTGIYCGCIAGFDSWRIDEFHSCGKCQGLAC